MIVGKALEGRLVDKGKVRFLQGADRCGPRTAVKQCQFANKIARPENSQKLLVTFHGQEGYFQRPFQNGVASISGVSVLKKNRTGCQFHRPGETG